LVILLRALPVVGTGVGGQEVAAGGAHDPTGDGEEPQPFRFVGRGRGEQREPGAPGQ
jgi:hypothetical protein